MLAWENSNPKGNIRAVLSTIFNSDLFRGNGGRDAKSQNTARIHSQRDSRPALQHEWHRRSGHVSPPDTDGYSISGT